MAAIARMVLGVFLLIGSTDGFGRHFNQWLIRQYGQKAANHLFIRPDLGHVASFGGKRTSSDRAPMRPVLFVHGLSDSAGKLRPLAAEYARRGRYRSWELFAGSWGEPGNAVFSPMKCLYLKRIRAWVTAISKYSSSKIDIVAHSMGVPMSRKAIIGGKCLDTGEHLGPPLTHKVNVFIGVAGSNLGIPLCVLGGKGTTCDETIGLYPGRSAEKCEKGPSKLLQELWAIPAGREGKRQYTLWSMADELVPPKMCGNQLGCALKGQTSQVVYPQLSHWDVLVKTVRTQLHLLRRVRRPIVPRPRETNVL